MKSSIIQQIVIALILIILLVVILNPFNMWMPDMMHVMVLIALLLVFGLFAIFILREKAVDERDEAHRALAGRVGFLVGATLLTIAIAIEGFKGEVDNWLIITLVGMVLSKIGTRLYSDRNL